jgi:2-polyprenyl-3-methyl-5-hydroxy-6-metoxy-1,4-benzoquinol methylase
MMYEGEIKAGRSVTACNHCGGTAASHVFTKFGYDLVRCDQCGLAYIANPPSPEDLAASYQQDADYHNDLIDPASAAFAEMTRVAQTHMAFTARHVAGGRLVDVGCSAGLFLNEARDRGFDASGVEFSKGSADFARSHFGFDVTDGDIHALKANDASFDVVSMFDVIEHVPDPAHDMAVVNRLLKPGGMFIVSTPNIDGLFPRLSYLVAKPLDYWPHPEPPHHLYQFSVKTLGAMLDKAGFDVVGEHQLNISLAYSFGSLPILSKRPKLWPYSALFAPFAKIGPWIGMGDWFYLAARKRWSGRFLPA